MVEFSLETPLAHAVNAVIGPKLLEVGWVSSGDDGALTEIILLMLANSKTESEVASELSDILSLSNDDPTLLAFSSWLFGQVNLLAAQLNGASMNTGDDSAGFSQDNAGGGSGEMDTDMGTSDAAELNAPTGPRSMRNGNRGGREKRMIGHISKAMDRTTDNALHRVRGAGINTHRGAGRGAGRGQQRHMNQRAANIQNGFAGMANMAAGGPQAANWMMQGQPPNQMDLMAVLEQQNQMMMQLSQQLMSGGNNNGGYGQNRRGGGKSLFDRVQEPGQRGRRGNHHGHNQSRNHNNDNSAVEGSAEGGDDVEMGGNKREAPNPEESVCKYNLRCTNKDCKFAHQSPAAPPGTTVDVKDVCSFGAACKNRKCVGRHPSPAQKFAHQSEQDCKFFPNCQNPQCPFRHPSMPLCRNGADCTTENCKFTHVKTKCKFNPCLNPHCAFAHEDGQQGGFKDKVWTSEASQDHVSERKFVDDGVPEETVRPEGQDEMQSQHQASPDVDVTV
jgi:hypothetical protein